MLIILTAAGFCFAVFIFTKIARFASNVIRLLRMILSELRKLNRVELPVAATVEFYEIINGQEQRIENMFKKVSAPFRLKVAFKDNKGNLAQVDGAPVWSLTDESLAEILADENGMAALITPKGPVGVFKVQLSADADLGEGVKPILGESEVTLLPGDAEVVEISEE